MRGAHGYRTITPLLGEPSQKSDANSSLVELNQARGQLVAALPGVIEFRDHQRIDSRLPKKLRGVSASG
jgi:hypothetical protein